MVIARAAARGFLTVGKPRPFALEIKVLKHDPIRQTTFNQAGKYDLVVAQEVSLG